MTTTQNLTATPISEVAVGDIIVFGIDGFSDGFHEFDRDTVVAVDALGIHFACGTYIAATDHDVLIAR